MTNIDEVASVSASDGVIGVASCGESNYKGWVSGGRPASSEGVFQHSRSVVFGWAPALLFLRFRQLVVRLD